MRRTRDLMGRLAVAAVLALVLMGASCSQVLEYRSVQSDFEQAVAADNAPQLAALTSEARYEEIAEKLTDEYIAGLDARLQPNAWMLRALSEWRSGDLSKARTSSSRGLGLGNAGDYRRDQLILTMIPALVVDSQMVKRWQEAGEVTAVSADELAKLKEDGAGVEALPARVKDFATALGVLGEAAGLIDERTPQSVVNYFHYQRWRVIRNWGQAVTDIQVSNADGSEDTDGGIDARNAVRAIVAGVLGVDDLDDPFGAAADAEVEEIAPGDPLRELIRRQEG